MVTNVPTGAFYIFSSISAVFFGKSDGETKVNDADELAIYILKKANVSVVTGTAFGAPHCIRISYAASDDELKEAMKRMKKRYWQN